MNVTFHRDWRLLPQVRMLVGRRLRQRAKALVMRGLRARFVRHELQPATCWPSQLLFRSTYPASVLL